MSVTPDAASYLLQRQISDHGEHSLWIADESALYAASQLRHPKHEPNKLKNEPNNGLQALTNRCDVYQALQQAQITTQLNDFAQDSFANNSLAQIYFRVSKEKPITHRVINLASQWLRTGGTLSLCGLKQDGTKTYIEKAAKLFGDNARAQKDGQIYHANITKKAAEINETLDDNHYTDLREITVEDFTFLSKPGLFGWNKVDRGSRLLAQQLPHWLPKSTHKLTALDLGCGYGYLTLMAAQFPWQKMVATDNNFTATQTCQMNAIQKGIKLDVVLSDCADSITERFDIILCNPPFHQGITIDEQLTEKFLQQTAQHLAAKGKTLYVVNQFIALEKYAQRYFKQTRVIEQADGFKVVELIR